MFAYKNSFINLFYAVEIVRLVGSVFSIKLLLCEILVYLSQLLYY